ncbi:unnamed protein product [Polarella glacialis]|uniref:Uncharacterized protein n=1 Tax=Polarella glacialis TaxID=89957 RepID=A0A813EKC4_POLGL|nr:unnamed protein product [Polarella glacialis]CAE8658190.1 unnamed protein product [Polarella glacialis]
MATGVAGVAGAGAAAAAGFGLFGYNRENFLYDSELRFERFNAGREFAIGQQEQFRADIKALSALTAKKNGIYAVVATLDMALCVALYCAGRLGLHGPAPPGWIMCLWLTNNAASFGFMAVAIMLATHAMLRSQAAATHLLTRKIRVPVPTLKQLNQARKFASEFEQQSWGDIFRVPYLSNNGAPKTDDKLGKSRARSASPAPRASRKASSWIREEFDTDHAGAVTATNVNNLPADVAPEHFRLYGQCQKEWVQYDVYARIAIFMGFMCYIQSLAYYGLGHINIELKAFWVAIATPLVIEVLHVLLLRFDIITARQRQRERLPHCQWCGPAAVVCAAIGMALDFRVKFDMTAIVVTWVFIFAAFILQLIYALRLLEIVLPDNVIGQYKAKEQIGDSWWPTDWNIPSTFAHVLYIVAPPTRLQPGQFDIVREVKEGAGPDPFADAGEPRGGGPSALPKDAGAQVQYLDSVFDWALSEQVFGSLSEESQQSVKEEFAAYSGAKRAGNESEAPKVFQSCIQNMESMIAFEGMEGGAPAAGYNSDSGGSGGMSSGSEDEEAQDYNWEGRQVTSKTEPKTASSTAKGMEPWRMVSSIQAVLCGAWVFLLMAMIVDVFCGDQAFVTGPHWSKPPMTRMSLPKHELGTPLGFPWYAGAKPFIPEQMSWHEEKREAMADVITGGRRLASIPTLVDHTSHLKSALHGLLDMIPSEAASAAGHALSVSWPGFFEPRLLACGPHGVAALTSRGVGAMLAPTPGHQQAQTFRLGGLGHLPPLLAASWQPSGASDDLLVVTHAGDLAACPGPRPPAGGIWACGSAAGAARLPVTDGSRVLAAAATWLRSHTGEPQLHVAFIDKAVPDLVALFALIGACEGEAASWMPLGEVRVPDDHKASLAFMGDGELLITTAAGAVLRRRLRDGAIMADSTHSFGGSHSSLQWLGACGLHDAPEGSLAHLRLHRGEGSQVWRPEIMATGLDALEAAGPLFQ